MKSSKDSTDRKQQQRSSRGPLLLGLLIVGVLAAIVIPFYLGFSNMMGGSAPQTAQQFASSSPGSQAKVAVEVISVPSQTLLTGNLLQKNSDGTYSRTGKTVQVKWSSTTSLAMGSSSDVKVGAIIQVSGLLDANDVLTAGQIVILTNFAQLK